MKAIEHNNIFELLSVDLDLSEEQVQELLRKKGKMGFLDYLKTQDMGLHQTPLTLGSEILDSSGKVLINKGIAINKYLSGLLDRYMKDDYFQTKPFQIECDNEAFKFYRTKSTDKVTKILNNQIYTQDEYAAYFNVVKKGRTKSNFDDVISNVLSTIDGISALLKILVKADLKNDLVLNSFNTSFISLSLTPYLQSKAMSDNSIIVKTGMTALLQDIAAITGQEKCIGYESTSAKMISGIVNDTTVEEAVRMKNCAIGDHCAPIFSDRENRNNFYLRMIVTVNLFVDLVHQNKTEPSNLEVHKSLYELAEVGYADREIANLLSKLFLPELKYLLLQQAYKLKDMCPECPVVWSTTGDMLPVKFLCLKEDCLHTGQHKTFIADDIKIKAENTYETRIVSGVYYSCNKLTRDLQDYFKTISRK